MGSCKECTKKLTLANAVEKARIAYLIDKHKLSLAEIDQLTDAEIYDYYMHPRDKEGNIKFPEPELETVQQPKSLDKLLEDIGRIGKLHRWHKNKIEAKKKAAVEKWHEKHQPQV